MDNQVVSAAFGLKSRGAAPAEAAPYARQEQEVNKLVANPNVLNWNLADVIGFSKYGKRCFHGMTAHGLAFLVDVTSAILVCKTFNVWAIEPGDGGEDVVDAEFEAIDSGCARLGLTFSVND